ncbi:MAG: hypothetical protein ABI795_06045, partial [Chthoniobacterales bacterium]
SIAISETRPPMTAGPMPRTLKLLNRISESCGALGCTEALGDGEMDADVAGAAEVAADGLVF